MTADIIYGATVLALVLLLLVALLEAMEDDV